MPDLYVSVLGAPFRAAMAHAGGTRTHVKIADRGDNDFGLDPIVWIDYDGATSGAQASFLERSGHQGEFFRVSVSDMGASQSDSWSARDVLAVLLRRIFVAAELQSGEGTQRVIVLIPVKLSDAQQSEITQACLLAGAQDVVLVSLDRLLTVLPAFTRDSGARALIIEAWDDATRLTVVDSATDGAARTVDDLSERLSRDSLKSILAESLKPDQERELDDELIERAFLQWIAGKDVSHGITLSRAAVRAAPDMLHVPAATFAKLDNHISDRLDRYFKGHDVELAQVGAVMVVGSWTRPIARAIRSMVRPGTPVRDEFGTEVEVVIKLVPPQARAVKATLSNEILAVPESARTLRALSQGEPIRLLSPGARLPATAVVESFRSSSFLGNFAIASQVEGKTTPLLSIAIPGYAERQQSSYLRTVVHAQTQRFIFLETAYLYSSQRRFLMYDYTESTSIPISDHVFRMIRG